MTRLKSSDNDRKDYKEPIIRKKQTEEEFRYLQELIKDPLKKERLIIETAEGITLLEKSKLG